MAAEKPILSPISDFPLKVVNEPIPGGFYLKARCIQNSAIATAAPHVREIWDWLIKEANYLDNKTHGVIIKRGQLFTDYNEIINGLSWCEGFIKKHYKKHHVDYAMRWLRQEQMITTQKTTRGLIITICKYDYYQNAANYEYATDYDRITTGLRQPTATIQKKGNKVIKEESEGEAPKLTPKEFYAEQIALNEKAEFITNYKGFVDFLYGANEAEIVYKNVLAMQDQLTYKQYIILRKKWLEQGMDLRDILGSMQNDKSALKGKTCVFLTLNSWANIRKDRSQAKKK
jgi:hypothetical protein